MNLTANTLQPGQRGPALGWGVSLLVHAAIIAWLIQAMPPRPRDAGPVARMEIRLAPLRPPAPAAVPPTPASPIVQPAPAVPPAKPAERTPPRRQPRAQADAAAHAPARPREAPAPEATHETTPEAADAPPVITSSKPSTPATAARPDTVPAPDTGPAAAPTVDIAAARQAARAIARAESRNLVGLPKRKPVVDPNSGKAPEVDPIEQARKKDCRTAYAGAGILAVIPLVASAVIDTGCKW